MDRIRFDFPRLPVSVNKLYTVIRGRKVLGTAGKKFKNEFIATRGGIDAATLMAFIANPEGYYDLHVWCFLPYEDLYNLNYGTDKRTKYPFKNIDVSNFFKLAEDCVSALVGLNDRSNWSIHAHKREAPSGKVRLVASLQPLDIEEDPYDFEKH
jgi:hypothetical protein